MLTPSMEDYLKAVYKLQGDQGLVAPSAVAGAMGVTAASATNMLKRLAEVNLVEYERYRGVTLTPDGRRAALEIIRHHRLIELYLQHALGYSWDEVDAEAERLEHAVSPEFAQRIEAWLGHPTHDPHGHPIPSRDLEMPADAASTRLADLDRPATVRVRTVDDTDPARLRYLAELGLLPDVTVEVLAIGPFDGPLTLQVGDQTQVIGRELARSVTIDEP